MPTSINVRSMGWTRRDAARYFQEMIEERYRRVGQIVKRERVRRGLTHEDPARLAGTSVKTIQRVEKGISHEHRPSTYRKIAAALEIPLPSIMTIILGEADVASPPGEGGDVRLPGPPEDAADQRLKEDDRPSDEDRPEADTG